MKKKRNLSRIYFRSKNEETGKFVNVVFEDLIAPNVVVTQLDSITN